MSGRATWWMAGGGAVVILALVVGLLGLRFEKTLPAAPEGVARTATPQIGLSRLSQVSAVELVAEEALFFDPSPLFLPTEWNADQNVLPASVLRDPGQMFQDFQARLVFKRDSLTLNLPEAVPMLQKPAEVVSGVEDLSKLSGMGEGDAKIARLKERGGYIEVVAAGTGRIVLQEALDLSGLASDLWRPLELSGVVNAAGLVGQLSVVDSTGAGELDQRIRDHVVKSLHLGQRLAPGFYRIFVGP